MELHELAAGSVAVSECVRAWCVTSEEDVFGDAEVGKDDMCRRVHRIEDVEQPSAVIEAVARRKLLHIPCPTDQDQMHVTSVWVHVCLCLSFTLLLLTLISLVEDCVVATPCHVILPEPRKVSPPTPA